MLIRTLINNLATSNTRKEPIYPNTLIASIDNFLVDYRDETLYLSRNGGESYDESLPIPQIEIIKYIHVFDNGELLVCDHQKSYYSHDWINLQESEVFNVDGTPFVPSEFDNFTLNKKGANRQVIEGSEVLCWGNYSIASPMPPINVWYTTDKGKTINSCYRFNASGNLSARHIHLVDFNPADNSFWVQTGDENSGDRIMSHVVKGFYNMSLDKWTWETVGSGLSFKWSIVAFYEDKIYFAHDISGGGIKTCSYAEVSDSAKHEQIMRTSNDTIGMYIGERGDMIVFQSVYGGSMQARRFYYSTDRVNFVIINGGVPSGYDYSDVMYYGMWAPNAKGKVLVGVWSRSHEPLDQWKRIPSVFVDDYIHQAGYPLAFKPAK